MDESYGGGEMTTRTIVLPRLVGTRDLARDLVREAHTAPAAEETAVVSARAVDVAAPSFVDELVLLLKNQGVKEIKLHGASSDLLSSLKNRAELHGSIRVTKDAA